MNEWKSDKLWSDRFIPMIKPILGTHLIGEASREEDAERNTDLIVLRMEAVRIGCRIRRFDAFEKYSDEFTIRASRPSGNKTELAKIVEGWGDYFFYGFSNYEEDGLEFWALADLKVFRTSFMANIWEMNYPKKIPNKDGGSEFYAFRWDEFPARFVVAQKSLYEEQPA